MFVRAEFFCIELKSKSGFEKKDMHVVIIIESTTIVSSIHAFQTKLVPMFFHMDSIIKFKNSIQSWRSTTIVVIVIGVKGIKDIKGEKQLLIIDREGEFDQYIIVFSNNFKTKYGQLPIYYNINQEYDKNIKRRSIFEGTTLHILNKGC
jgi:hypothetical protein